MILIALWLHCRFDSESIMNGPCCRCVSYVLFNQFTISEMAASCTSARQLFWIYSPALRCIFQFLCLRRHLTSGFSDKFFFCFIVVKSFLFQHRADIHSRDNSAGLSPSDLAILHNRYFIFHSFFQPDAFAVTKSFFCSHN